MITPTQLQTTQAPAGRAAKAVWERELAGHLVAYLQRTAPNPTFEDCAAAALYAARLRVIERDLQRRARIGFSAERDAGLAALQAAQTRLLRESLSRLSLPPNNVMHELLEQAEAVGAVVLRAMPAASEAVQ